MNNYFDYYCQQEQAEQQQQEEESADEQRTIARSYAREINRKEAMSKLRERRIGYK
jgi:hypothetical protein